ncbi:MAG: serine/threonine protein kinase [Myxococcales bacterium]|nr:serine/threonine protein kinase [Myxococcales bacterium]
MSPSPDDEIAGRYRLVRRLGSGGMGEVWVARHLELDVHMALKLIAGSRAERPNAERRFRREARAAAKLKSPHIARIHDFGRDEGRLFLVMELLEGQDLESVLEAQAMTLGEASFVVEQLGRALEVIHAGGIVHRDIKPSNIFLARDGGAVVTKVLDFGIAKALGEVNDTTDTGAQIGSLGYMSPEQLVGDPVSAKSDLWSLACVTYEMLAGHGPFEGTTPVRLHTEIAAGHIRPLPEGAEQPALMAFFRRALARDPGERPASAGAFLAAFRTAAGAPTPVAPDLGAQGPEPRDEPTVSTRASSQVGRTDRTASVLRRSTASERAPARPSWRLPALPLAALPLAALPLAALLLAALLLGALPLVGGLSLGSEPGRKLELGLAAALPSVDVTPAAPSIDPAVSTALASASSESPTPAPSLAPPPPRLVPPPAPASVPAAPTASVDPFSGLRYPEPKN